MIRLDLSRDQKRHLLIALARKGEGRNVTVSAKALADLIAAHNALVSRLNLHHEPVLYSNDAPPGTNDEIAA